VSVSPLAKKPGPDDILWKEDPDPSTFKAATAYLSLLMPKANAKHLVSMLKVAPESRYRADDLLRAAGLKPADDDDPTYQDELDKVKAGEPWSPVLIVACQPLIIADGYHRISVACDLGEADVLCRKADYV
jgi:hypothetical protein